MADENTNPLDPSAVAAALSPLTSAFEDFSIPGMEPSTEPGPGAATMAAFAESGAEAADFLQNGLTGYGQQTADIITNIADRYQMAFQNAAGNVPMPGEPPAQDPNDPAPGTATAAALATGLDNLGAAVGNSLGTEEGESGQDYGLVYAGQTVGDALIGLGGDFETAAGLFADAFEAGAEALAGLAPEGGGPGMDMPGEEMLAGGIATGLAALKDGFNMGAEALSGTVPEEIAGGIETLGAGIVTGAETLTGAFTENLPEEETDPDQPDPAQGIMDIIDGLTANLPPEDFPPEGGFTPPEELSALTDLLQPPEGGLTPPEELTGLLDMLQPPEGGLTPPEELTGLLDMLQPPEGGLTPPEELTGLLDMLQPPEGGLTPPEELTGLADTITSGIASGATQFEMVLTQLENLAPAA